MPVTAFPEILTTLWTSPKPVVARVGGPARAGGIGLVAACDIAVAARSATFAFTEVRIGRGAGGHLGAGAAAARTARGARALPHR